MGKGAVERSAVEAYLCAICGKFSPTMAIGAGVIEKRLAIRASRSSWSERHLPCRMARLSGERAWRSRGMPRRQSALSREASSSGWLVPATWQGGEGERAVERGLWGEGCGEAYGR